jgi:hypothetical protein
MASNRARQIPFAAAFALIALAGCNSATGSNSGTAAPTPGGGAATTPGGAATTSGGGAATPATGSGKLDGVPKACPSADAVMSNLNLSKLVLNGNDPSICQYLYNGDPTTPYAVITFNAAPGMTAAMMKDGLTKGQASVKPVSGVGDAAFAFTPKGSKGAGLTFLSGTTVCSIYTTQAITTTAGEAALAHVILRG